MKLAIWTIRSPLDDSLEGECVSVSISMSSGLSQYMCEFSPLLGSGSKVELNAVAGSVVLLSKTLLVPVDVVCQLLATPDFEPVRRSPSL
jgi:hypothetical protein